MKLLVPCVLCDVKKKQKNYEAPRELLSSASSSTVPPVPVFSSSYSHAKRRALLASIILSRNSSPFKARRLEWGRLAALGGRRQEKGPEEAPRRVLC